MGPYRAERISRLLGDAEKLDSSDFFQMHFDVYSPQAEGFMAILGPLLPNTEQGDILFEEFYKRLYREVFGTGGLGETAVSYLDKQTGIFVDFYFNFDQVLLSETSAWFNGNRGRCSTGVLLRRHSPLSLEPGERCSST